MNLKFYCLEYTNVYLHSKVFTLKFFFVTSTRMVNCVKRCKYVPFFLWKNKFKYPISTFLTLKGIALLSLYKNFPL